MAMTFPIKTSCETLLLITSFVCLILQLEVPKELISSSQLQKLRVERNPSFIPPSPEVNITKVHDKETGITQLRLSNGIPVNYKVYLVLKLLQGILEKLIFYF